MAAKDTGVKNSQYKLCPNHWMTDKLCMHGELKGLKGEKLAKAREKATLEKWSCSEFDAFSTGCIQLCSLGSRKLKPYKAEVSEPKHSRTVSN